MKAITICQPYAHLIITGAKRVENREWSTRYRGPLIIHAGKSRDWLDGQEPSPDMIFGAAVGIANIVGCVHIRDVVDGKYAAQYPWLRDHPHTEGTWCWILNKVQRFPGGIPWKGAQGLWEFPDQMLPVRRVAVPT